MNNVVVFDTAIGTSNLGDEIILQCLEEEMSFLLEDSFIMRFGTHIKNLPLRRFLFGSGKIRFAYNADFKIVMGTNLLSRDIKKTQLQWPVGSLDSWLYDNCIMAGVGTTLSEGETTAYTRKIYERILRKDFYHSVRDEESKRLLEDMDFKVLNTGCPTLWKLTPDFCREIPTGKAERVIFSLSGYGEQKDKKMDQLMLDVLRAEYGELIFWCQTSRDEGYLDSFAGTKNIKRVYSLNKFKEILQEGNIDYVGTRLHGGVFAMQNKVRSIVISIDHRARGFHDTNNLCICERQDIPEKLSKMINSEIVTDIKLRQDDIDRFKAQFIKNYPKETKKTHESLWYVKLVRLPRTAKKLLKKCSKKIRRGIGKIATRYYYFWIQNRANIETGKMVFFTFQGDYTCNLKYISKEIFKRNLPWKQVWVTLEKPEKVKGNFPEAVKLVKFNTREYYDQLSRSQIWLDNAFNYPKGYVKKKKGQLGIQTMHGSLGLKKIGPDVVKNPKRNDRGFRSADITDICISNSSFETMVYRTSFWKENDIQELGHARNDIFFSNKEKTDKIKEKVCRYFLIPNDVRLALFAPTFKNPDETTEYEAIDFASLRDALEKRFGGQWLILNRAHHSSLKNTEISTLPYVLDANDYPDIQELMIAIDLGITDYSSWICDYVLSYKPGLLYTPDLDAYDHNRGFYYPIEETPFPICKSNIELAKNIESFDENTFKKRTDKFLEERGCIDDGKASARIVDMLTEIVGG